MSGSHRFELVDHLLNGELDPAINAAQKTDEPRLIWRLCVMKNLYEGRAQQQVREAVCVYNPRVGAGHAHRTNDGVEGLRPRSGGGRPPKLTPAQWDEIYNLLKNGQPWMPQKIHTLIENGYGVTYHPTYLARKLRASGMHYAKPRPIDPRSREKVDEIFAKHLKKALGEDDHTNEDDDPVVLEVFR